MSDAADGPIAVRRVGYGKTEVAMRAAFKAVQDGKQVAVLTPSRYPRPIQGAVPLLCQIAVKYIIPYLHWDGLRAGRIR
jgi:hypothetical protein